MAYVDGFLLAVPAARLAEYRKLARQAGQVWMDHGAVEYWECVGDDLPDGKTTSFARSVKLKPGEVVIFSWIRYRSRAHRDRVNAKAMADPRIADTGPDQMPFDPKRMMYGGFAALVSRVRS